MRWDIFCQVIDNHGDLGVCWRLARMLADTGEHVRLWGDDPSALAWMAPNGHPGLTLVLWREPVAPEWLAQPAPDVLIEAFGCNPAPEWIAHYARAAKDGAAPHTWINLEYLSAEPTVERLHGLPSPVLHGPGAGLSKYFFYPGFTEATGGLLREPELVARQAAFDRAGWLRRQGVHWRGEQLLSLFCYEPPALAELLAQLGTQPNPIGLLITAGRASEAVRAIALGACRTWIADSENRPQRAQFSPDLQPHSPAMGQKASEKWAAAVDLQPATSKSDRLLDMGRLVPSWLPHMPQPEFDHLLWSCDINFVRGEDSLVRALWAGQPLVWQIYPQHDNAHRAKLDAFLDWLRAPDSLRRFHHVWNGFSRAALDWPDAPTLAQWRETVAAARAQLWAQDDLLTRLRHFVDRKS